MNIRDGLPDAKIPEFEQRMQQLPELIESLTQPVNPLELASTQRETLALAWLAYGSSGVITFLQKPCSRLNGMTPLICIQESEASNQKVLQDLFRAVEGYVF